MMNKEKGTFEPMDAEAFKKNLERVVPKPTITNGEIVEVKGVRFRVTYWKPNGKLGLRMIRTEPI